MTLPVMDIFCDEINYTKDNPLCPGHAAVKLLPEHLKIHHLSPVLQDKLTSFMKHTPEGTERDEVVSLLSGILCWTTDPGQCRQYLDKVTQPCWKQYVYYVDAYSKYKSGRYLEAITLLSGCDTSDIEVSGQMKAFMAHLFGLCLAELGKPHCAIQKYRESLKHDFSFLVPLYHISTQYRKLGLVEAELECLNLLVTASEDEKETLTFNDLSLIIQLMGTSEMLLITKPQALYAMAARCMELHKYDIAAQHYLDLLAVIHGTQRIDVSNSGPVHIPCIENIYQELTYSLLKSGDFESCLAVCKHVLRSKSTDSFMDSHSQNSSLSIMMSQPSTSRKRLRSIERGDNSTISSTELSYDLDLYMSVCKADALIFLGRIQEALEVVDSIEAAVYDHALLTANEEMFLLDDVCTPPVKRQRRSSDGESTSKARERRGQTDRLALFIADTYRHLGVALVNDNKYKDAVHCFIISLQLHPGSLDSHFNCTKTLWDMECQREAVRGWCKTRRLNTTDSFQVANLLQQKKSALRNTDKEDGDLSCIMDNVTDSMLLKMDVMCLEFVLRNGGKIG